MSSNNINPAEVLELILGLETTFYEIATLFVLWGELYSMLLGCIK